MSSDILKGNWKQLKGQVQKTWGKLTDDDLTESQGDYNKLVGRLQERYGWSKVQAEQQVNDFLAKSEQKTHY